MIFLKEILEKDVQIKKSKNLWKSLVIFHLKNLKKQKKMEIVLAKKIIQQLRLETLKFH